MQQVKGSQPIYKYTNLVFLSAFLLITGGILNAIDKYMYGWSYQIEYLGYVIFGLVTVSLIPLAISIREITDIYFVDHITKHGRETSKWFWIYGASVAINFVALGWPIIAPFASLIIIIGRVVGFYKLNKLMLRINKLFDIKIGSFVYVLFGFYSIIISLFTSIASWAKDLNATVFLFTFNGLIETLLIVAVAIKLTIDFIRIQKFILSEDIKPYSSKSSLFVKDRKDHMQLSDTKDHIQSRVKIAQLQERTRGKQVEFTPKKEIMPTPVIKKKEVIPVDDQYIECPYCNERTDRNIKLCTNCGVVFSKKQFKEFRKTKNSEITDITIRSKRILSIKKERILQQIVIAIFLIAFVTYSFLGSNNNLALITYSYIVIAIFVTYLIVNYIVLFLVGGGYAILTAITDILFMFVMLPILSAIFTFFALNSIGNTLSTGITDSLYQGLMIGLTIGLSFFLIYLILRFRVRSSNMNLREYLHFRFDFKARAEELNVEKKRVEKKRANFDNLDRIEANMARQREASVMDYKDFDYKERLKDLGSPLEDLEQDNREENESEEK